MLIGQRLVREGVVDRPLDGCQHLPERGATVELRSHDDRVDEHTHQIGEFRAGAIGDRAPHPQVVASGEPMQEYLENTQQQRKQRNPIGIAKRQ